MSRVLPRRRRRGGSRLRADRTDTVTGSPGRRAFVETEDEPGRTSTAPAPGTTETTDSPGTTAGLPASVASGGVQSRAVAHTSVEPVTMQVAVVEAPDPDLPALSAAAELSRGARPRGFVARHRAVLVGAWLAAVALGLLCLILALAASGPTYLDDLGATIVLTAYTLALAARTGGRPVVFAAVAAVAATAALWSGESALRTGAAMMTCVVSAVLAVVATVPATTYGRVVRECALATFIAAVGALATIGFAPTISLVRFEYATLAVSLLGALGIVFRLGAGLHGLGRRGVAAVVLGGAVLIATLIYAEALRRYGPAGTVDGLLGVVRASRDHLGAFPRPVAAVLGVPALAWGVHMRARRRQGWWVCAFGAAGTASFASSLANPAITLAECGLSVLYGLLVGLAIGWLLIRLDQALGGSGAGGRRAQDRAAARPEPGRTASLI